MVARTEHELNRKVDLYKVLKIRYGWESQAVWRLIHDGQVLIDGHVVLERWAKGHWRVRHLSGRMLTVPSRSVSTRLFQ